MKTRTLLLLLLFYPMVILFSQQKTKFASSDTIQDTTVNWVKDYIFDNKINRISFDKFPVKGLNNLITFFPGMSTYRVSSNGVEDSFSFRGSGSDAISYSIDGMNANNLFSRAPIITLPVDAIEQINFYNGNIPSNANNCSGSLFDYELRTGGKTFEISIENTSDNIAFSSNSFSGEKRLGAYWYGYNEFSASVGGPLFSEKTRYFVNINNLFKRDRDPHNYPGYKGTLFNLSGYVSSDTLKMDIPAGAIKSNSSQNTTLSSTLLFDLSNIQIKLSGIYSFERKDVFTSPIFSYFNSRNGISDTKFALFQVKLNHRINDDLNYKISIGYWNNSSETYDSFLKDNYYGYGDSVANANAGAIWVRNNYEKYRSPGRFKVPTRYSVSGYYFYTDNTPTTNYSKSEQSQYSFDFVLNYNLMKNNILSTGAKFDLSIIRKWNYLFQNDLAGNVYNYKYFYPNSSDEFIKELYLRTNGVDNIGCDILGNYSDEGYNAPPKSKYFSAFLNDNFRIDDLFNIEIGLRYDYVDLGYKTIDPNITGAYLLYDHDTMIPLYDNFINSIPYSKYSPRVVLDMPINSNTHISFSYNQRMENQDFSNLFLGYNKMIQLASYWYYGFIPAADIKPQISTNIDLSMISNNFKNLTLRANLFYKETTNRLSLKYLPNNSTNLYYASSEYVLYQRGIEISVGYNNYGLELLSNLSYTDPNRYYSNVFPLDRDLKYIMNSSLNYDFNYFFNDNTFLKDLALSLQFTYRKGTGKNISWPYMNSEVEYSLTDFLQIDMKLEKSIKLSDNFKLSLYLYAINLFDKLNGTGNYSGLTSRDSGMDSYLKSMYGDSYFTLLFLNSYDYNAMLFGPPRQIGFGIKLDIK